MAPAQSIDNQAVIKTLNIISFLVECNAPMRLQDIAETINIPTATVLRYLNSLISEGYVYRDEISNRYSATWRICWMGDYIRSHQTIRMVSSTMLNDLSLTLSCGVCLVTEQNFHCVYLDLIDNPLRLDETLMRIGKKTPLHCTGSGKLFLSSFSEEHFHEYIKEIGLERFTKNTITSEEILLRELEEIRKRGYAFDREECEENLVCVSRPIYDYSEYICAAVSAFGPTALFTEDRIHSMILPELTKVANEMSFRLGCGKNHFLSEF